MSTNDAKASRQSLRSGQIQASLDSLGSNWATVHVADQVTSTNVEVLKLSSEVRPGNAIALTADEQVRGRGRLEREWSSPWGAGIALSICCSIDDVAGEVTSVPLRTGLAVVTALQDHGVASAVKWPNDIVTIDDPMRKLGGILVSLHPDVLVIGIGLNVSLTHDELPTQQATSLSLLGHDIDRELLIGRIIHSVEKQIANDDWVTQYRAHCRTLGQEVRISRVGDESIVGLATDISGAGEIIVDIDGELLSVSVGDVEHLRLSKEA